MEREKLLAQVKAFQTYLKNYIEDAKSHPQIEEDEENEQISAELYSISNELGYIEERYEQLKQAINGQYHDIFGHITPDFSRNRGATEHMYREISFILDTISNLNNVELNQQNFKSNNQPFTKDEVLIINKQLNDLQTKLIETISEK